jgi:uncharacterized protein (UPF0332 family)
MQFAEALLALALHLAKLEIEPSRQASLRRAVSTAYYALFHLLVSEATLSWNQVEQRSSVGRLFEHGTMKSASEKQAAELTRHFKMNPQDSSELTIARNLFKVANTFVRAQQDRHEADYDTSVEWEASEVLDQVDSVSQAFESWKAIREKPEAQAYLLSLMIHGKRAFARS